MRLAILFFVISGYVTRFTDTFFAKIGAVAQLGERQNRTLEVGGSTPLCSTNDFNGLHGKSEC